MTSSCQEVVVAIQLQRSACKAYWLVFTGLPFDFSDWGVAASTLTCDGISTPSA